MNVLSMSLGTEERGVMDCGPRTAGAARPMPLVERVPCAKPGGSVMDDEKLISVSQRDEMLLLDAMQAQWLARSLLRLSRGMAAHRDS